MFIAVVFGRVLAAVMAFCGLFSVFYFLQSDVQNLSAGGFALGLALASWPLAVAMIIFTLVQVAILLEKLVLCSTIASSVQLSPRHAEKKVPSQPKSVIPPVPALQGVTQGNFFHIAPDSIPAPSPEELQAELLQADAAAESTLRTDSRHIAAEVEAANDGDAPRQAEEHRRHPNEELNFFRVD